ncbi:hypothetical protein LWI29_024811 [Acer saccharum]|uniref:Uncharacterized protein n=1 Tax=Acer saccharum TaxID=4024 RepID=A0AA39THL9_ACESA|nr:hypothetical protein LWI29_024811 [Acer saccharum]
MGIAELPADAGMLGGDPFQITAGSQVAEGIDGSRLCAGPPAPVDQRRSPAQNAQWSAAGRALVWTSARPPAPIAQVCAAGLALVAAPVVQRSSQNLLVRWSTSAQCIFLASFQNDLTSLMASIYMLT